MLMRKKTAEKNKRQQTKQTLTNNIKTHTNDNDKETNPKQNETKHSQQIIAIYTAMDTNENDKA